MNANIGSALIVFLHDLFTAVWIGGLVAIALTALPASRRVLGKGPQLKQLMDEIMKRQSLLVYISMFGLAITGLLQAKQGGQFEGLFSFGNSYSTVLSLKHLIMLSMVAIALVRTLVLGKPSRSGNQQSDRLSIALLYLNVALGVVVLLLSGFLAVM
jgi:putative copper export protein